MFKIRRTLCLFYKLGGFYLCCMVMMLLLNITLCATVALNIDREDELIVSELPHGKCLWCCPLNLEKDIKFLLYTRRNRDNGITISHSNPEPEIRQSPKNSTKPTIIYLHGFVEKAPSFSTRALKDAYLDRDDYNVILVDWGTLAAGPWYINAVKNTNLVGLVVAKFLQLVDKPDLFPLNNIHLIGFSLGAEAAGFAGKAMPKNKKIPRITGLDPAFPLYFGGPKFHLSKGDAEFVDVIHTDAGMFGYPLPIGDVDFYPNLGVKFQPGCLFQADTSRLLSCSHLRAWRYYVESVRNPQGFPATRCFRWRGFLPPCKFRTENFMGFLANPRVKGRFYLETNARPPFAKRSP